MNSLGINLKKGQKVVMEGDPGMPEAHRTVTVEDGFGMCTFTSGTALFVTDRFGESIRMDAMEIEKVVEETPVEK